MEYKTILITLITLISWGVSSFISKLSTNKIGGRGAFWEIVAYAPAIIIISLILYKTKDLLNADRSGIILAMLAGIVGSFGFIGYYMLLSRKEASLAVPLTSLFPALTAILAFIFLRESVTLPKIIGIILSLIALYLLSI